MYARKITALAVFSIAGLSLTACGAEVEKNATYESVNDFREVVVSEEIVDCPEASVGYDAGGLESMPCGTDAALAVWPKDSAVASTVIENTVDNISSGGVVRGPNWLVVSPDVAVLSKAHDKLGGTIKVIVPSD